MGKITGIISIPLGHLLSFIYGIIANYGITIIIFTAIVRLCLFPLYISQTKSTVKMQAVQPKIKEIQRKYANDKETLNIKMMELYKEEKFNPMKGCLPLLIQLPIIWGLFGLLRNPMKYISGDGMLTAIHESFLWIPDLSQPDPWILPILAGISTFFSFIISQAQTQSVAADNPMGSSMKMMKYFFPIMIIWMGKAMPAGLTLYWFFGTTIQVVLSQILSVWKKKYTAKMEED